MAKTDDDKKWHGFKSGTPEDAQKLKDITDKVKVHAANILPLMSSNREVGIGRPAAQDIQQPAAIVNLTGTPKTSMGGTLSGPAAPDSYVKPSTLQTLGQAPQGQSLTQFTDSGSGKMRSSAAFPKPGSTLLNAGDPNNPRAVPTNLNQLASAGKQTGITRGNGFEFQGTAEDAAKFMRPVGNGPQMVPTGRMIQARSASDYLPKEQTGPQMPKYLGPESGIGWKTRAKIYEAQMDAYNKATGNQTALNIEGMREAGAGQRTLAQANQWNVENQLNAKKINSDTVLAETQNQVGQLALLQEQNLQAARNEYMKNPTVENKTKLDALMYDPRNKDQKPDAKVLDQFDPISGEKTGQIVVRDDGTGNYVDAMKPQQPQEHPAIAYLRANDTPENRAIFIKRFKRLPDGM